MLTRDETKPLKLSEAIRLGAMLKPQLTNGVTRNAEGTCAFGAALEAIGCDRASYAAAGDYFPIVFEIKVHPVTKEPARLVLSVVRELNDQYEWTRERIADWVETVEAAQAHGEPAHADAVRLTVERPGVPLRV